MKTGILSSRFALVTAAALAASVSGCGVGQMQPDDTLLAAAEVAVDSLSGFEAETMTRVSGRMSIEADPSASAGRSLVFYRNGVAARSFSASSELSAVVVVARGEQCQGAPSLRVMLDGAQIHQSAIASSSWGEYRTALRIPAGAHRLEVGFDNDFHKSGVCDRNLRIDRVRFEAAAVIDAGALDAGSADASTAADAGLMAADGGTATPDAGSTAADGGTAIPDAGSTPADGGTTSPDAGSTAADAGSPVADAGSNPTTGATYYVDPAGSDSNSGTSPSAAWASNAKVAGASLQPGDAVLFKRGSTFSGALKLSRSGLDGKPITIGSYGTGALPVLNSVNLTGSYLVLREVQVDNGAWAGVDLHGSHNRIERCLITRNVAGIFVRPSATSNAILDNDLTDNNRMSVLTSGGDDDSGAFGILLQGDDNEIARNRISGSDAFSYDYGRDGAAVEVYGGQRNHIHHNSAWACDAFTELGNSRSADNTFAYNTFRSSNANSIFLVTRGASSSWGPVLRTRIYNNTVQLSGAQSQGFVCHGGCSSSVLAMRNNVIEAVLKAGYADAAFDEDYNLFSGATQFPRGAHSLTGSPQFRSPATGDLRLQPTSPAVDRGVSLGYTVDLDNAGVPHDGNGDGVAAPDLGAYELH